MMTTPRSQPGGGKPLPPQPARSRLLLPVLAVLLLAIAFALAWMRFQPQPPVADDRHYVAMAWNLAAHGVPSLASPQDAAPAPTMFREPGYPLLLAGLMRLVPAARGAALCAPRPEQGSADDGMVSGGDCLMALRLGYGLNLALILAAAACAALAARRLCGAAPAALLALALIAFNPKIVEYATFMISESLALALAAAAALLLLPAAGAGSRAWGASLAAGIACGALAATKQAFLPLLLPAAIGVAVAHAWRDRAGQPAQDGRPAGRRYAAGGLRGGLLAVGWAAVVAPWLLWNLSNFGSPLPSDRAREGEVLAYRVELLEMTAAEYGMAWLWWTSNFGDNWARDGFAEADWRRFEDHRADGFTPASHDRWVADVAARQAQGLTPGQAYDAVTRDYQARLLEAWPRHLMISLPVLNRGLWVDSLALLGVPCLLAVLALAWRWGLGRFYLFALPGLTGLAVHTGLTNNIPRWNLPLAPVLAVATALVAWRLGGWLRGRWRRRRKTAAWPPRAEPAA